MTDKTGEILSQMQTQHPPGTMHQPRGIASTDSRTPAQDVSGASGSVLPMRPVPGQTPPDAYSAALERLMEAMLLVCTAKRGASDDFKLALKIAALAAPLGAQGHAVEKILLAIHKRLENQLAATPNAGPVDVA